MGPIVCPETSVRNYHYTLRISPEERSSQDGTLSHFRQKHRSDLNIGGLEDVEVCDLQTAHFFHHWRLHNNNNNNIYLLQLG